MRSAVLLFFLATILFAHGFRPTMRTPISFRQQSSLRMMSEDKPTSIVPVDKVNIENAAAFTGGILGLVLGGPLGAIAIGALANYLVKKDDEAGEALRGVGKAVVETFNFLTKVNSKYDVTDKVVSTVSSAVSKVEVKDESLEKVKDTVTGTVSKVQELNSEYDLVGKGAELLNQARSVSDKALEKLDELNTKYDFLKVAKTAVAKAVEKVKETTAAKE